MNIESEITRVLDLSGGRAFARPSEIHAAQYPFIQRWLVSLGRKEDETQTCKKMSRTSRRYPRSHW